MTSGVGTVAELLARVAGEKAQRGGLLVASEQGNFCEMPWRRVIELACQGAAALTKAGIEAGDRVAIAATNSLEWVVADFAVGMLGAVLVPLHTSLSGPQLAWQLRHSSSRLLIVGSAELHQKLAAHLPSDASPLRIVSVSEWSAMIGQASVATGQAHWQRTLATVTPNTLASIVYTSGTSGEPKGVMLTQGNLAANALAIVDRFGLQPNECRLNTLPFSHAYGRMSDLYVSLAGNTRLGIGRNRESLVADAQHVQPTLLVVVPLLLLRLQQGATAKFGPDDPFAIRKLLGGQVRGFICGGASLTSDLHAYFAAQQTPVWEGYGLTEASPVVSLSSPVASRENSVGRVIASEAKIAADGELFIRGPQVMAGYWQDEASTREVLDNGWLHTGDLARLDDDGYLLLLGRKKEFIALSTGKKVWPAQLEERFAHDPIIEQIIVVGEGQNALGALIVPRQATWFGGDRNEDLSQFNTPAAHERMLVHLAAKLVDCADHEQIRHVRLLTEPFSAEREELTPKFTLRRPVILDHYADCVRQMFCDD
ncbi:long-chain fatty acid--CoA ligase [Anatilimnocola sp. NA78]|uniref:AMP-dependent synthetase/ligase n=1 Tax=Anatilimnocola sp. NA78 TaxID=3415683 RepID=UPI003CE5105D